MNPEARPSPATPPKGQPIRLALMNDYQVVVAGLQEMLAPYSARVRVVEIVSLLPVQSAVDVVLYDGFSHERITEAVGNMLRASSAPFVLYTWNLDKAYVHEALEAGVAACVSKSLPAEDLVAAIEKVAAGSTVISDDPGPDAPVREPTWPGREHGLSPRESEIIALIAQGLTNQQVAERAYLSINSVKTFIRSAYRKMGVQRRTQAVIWASEHGFIPTASRTIYD
jgi:two-component system, NarL family, response regulator LiaR